MISVLRNQKINKKYRHRINVKSVFRSNRERIPVSPSGLKYLITLGSIFLMLVYLFTSSKSLSFLIQNRKNLIPVQSRQEAQLESKVATTPLIAGVSTSDIAALSAIAVPAVFTPGLSSAESGNQEVPARYVVKNGDTLYTIAESYHLSVFSLIRQNRITDPTRIRKGQILKLNVSGSDGSALPASGPVRISANVTAGTAPLKVSFSSETPLVGGTYMWDMGNWKFAFSSNPSNVFTEPGNYAVRLRVYSGNRVISASNNIRISVLPPRRAQGKARFVTLAGPNDVLDLSAVLCGESSHSGESSSDSVNIYQNPVLFQDTGNNMYRAVRGGYTRITSSGGQSSSKALFAFVSPYPSRHAREPKYNWYKTQFGTGIMGNCGPAVIAMASNWATGRDTAVSSIRSEIGMPFVNGAVNFEHMLPVLRKRNVQYLLRAVTDIEDIKDVINRKNIAIILIHTGQIEKTSGDSRNNLVGRYYNDSTGHYIIVKGYTLDGKYLIVYDPIPSDWKNNTLRYADGESMLGRNRYYPSNQIMRALRREEMIEIYG